MKNLSVFFRAMSQRQDLALVMVLMLTIGMLILPLPAVLADILIGCNLSISVLLLMVAVYLRSPLDLTALPGMILVSTVFRLALEVTVTRLILTTADAGTIVETFGEFVIGGNIVVGLVVFAIVTTVQFIVVTKGTERVAEVGARFTLDAMPGKQMSIDSDLRSGDIDQAEARRRRQELASESALHGAMDGALKFVKGDAIAGLIIIVVNLVGGIAIGTAQRGMPVGQAMHTYTLLTVGDALISQIPALLLSITAAIVVTRVGGHGTDLGRDMAGQLMANRGALRIASILLLIMALIPGFPKPVFLGLAALFFCGSRPNWKYLRNLILRRDTNEVTEADNTNAPPGMARGNSTSQSGEIFTSLLSVTITPLLDQALDRGRLERLLSLAVAEVESDLGIRCPRPHIRVGGNVGEPRFSIDLEDVPIEEHTLRLNHLVLQDDPMHLDLAGIDGESGLPLLGREPTVWVATTAEGRLKTAGIGYSDNAAAIAFRFRLAMRRHAGRFIGLQEARQIVQRAEGEYGDLVREATRIVPTQRLAEILRRLVEEEVSLRNIRMILETLVEWGEKETRAPMLVEHVRQALSRQICHRYANQQKTILAFVVAQDTEQTLRQAVRETPAGAFLALDPDMSQQLLGAIKERFTNAPGVNSGGNRETQPIIVCSLDTRRFVRGFLTRNSLDYAVLSYQDLAEEFPVHPIGTISLGISANVQAAVQKH
ncbi:type III secretion system export apparatus subunit SctV [Kozakia baliensis]|uniref:type III secretion system export apparatus subunit SctV n=1 Tax=Kozakia baliensis TaxID=153496 RepID=UPI0009DD0A7C|nr:type III secretion system export apparatus subunit SctV [Kozakia baliensis]